MTIKVECNGKTGLLPVVVASDNLQPLFGRNWIEFFEIDWREHWAVAKVSKVEKTEQSNGPNAQSNIKRDTPVISNAMDLSDYDKLFTKELGKLNDFKLKLV